MLAPRSVATLAAFRAFTTPLLPPDQANNGWLSWASRLTSVVRAERMGPTGSEGAEWKTANKRVIPSTISS